ncbi:3'(2'),5'-bisphosphate nucleotidase CysQ [Novosphingopyxis sp.]|uniref:3'(2'),5'-bisphosphate nucleotidase CysQ n=1 Tax=Novosphingopyxis sp. TaxID=2709690 RepID=UPI003B5B5A12
MDDIELARHLADGAGRILLDLRAGGAFSGKELGKAGDSRANVWLMDQLARHRPDDGVLSEETKDTPARLSRSRVWIIDPVDGTREYGEGRTDWAVHVGMAVDGHASLGAVALPGMDLILDSADPPDVPKPASPLRLVVSRTRPSAEAVKVAEKLDAELVPMGSAGAKAMAVVRGEADIYLHSGGQYEWDNCAPVAVAEAAGLHCSRIDGSALRYNNEDTYLPDLLICPATLADPILAMIAELELPEAG